MSKHKDKHNHTKCKHEVQYCEDCNVCYCTKCGKEWVDRPLISFKDNTTEVVHPPKPWVSYAMNTHMSSADSADMEASNKELANLGYHIHP